MALATLVLSELGPAGWVHLTAAVRLTFVRPVICSCRLPCCEVYDPAGRQTTNRTRRAVSNLDVANFLNGLDEINGSVLMASLATEPMVATALVRMLVRGVGAEGEEGDEHAKGAKAARSEAALPPCQNTSPTKIEICASAPLGFACGVHLGPWRLSSLTSLRLCKSVQPAVLPH